MYGPVGFLGYLSTQYFLSGENAYNAQIVYSTILMLLLQFFRIRSAYVFALITAVLLTGVRQRYAIPILPMIALAVEGVTSVSPRRTR